MCTALSLQVCRQLWVKPVNNQRLCQTVAKLQVGTASPGGSEGQDPYAFARILKEVLLLQAHVETVVPLCRPWMQPWKVNNSTMEEICRRRESNPHGGCPGDFKSG